MNKRAVAVLLSIVITVAGIPVSAFGAPNEAGNTGASGTETAAEAGTDDGEIADGSGTATDGSDTDTTKDTADKVTEDRGAADDSDTAQTGADENGDDSAAADGGDVGKSGLDDSSSDKKTDDTVSKNAQALSVSADSAEDDELFPGEAEWLKKHGMTKNADGMYEYIDKNGKLWIFDPEDPELFKYFSDDKEEPQEYEHVRNRMNGFYDGQGLVYSDPYLFPLDARYYRYPPYYQSSTSRPVIRYGIDVSKFQGVISESKWRTLKNTYGMDFAFIRAGYRGYGDSGSLNVDNCFKSNIKNAYNAGVKVGVYYFSQAISESEARAEADHCMEICSDYKSMITLPMVIDYEYNGNPGRLKKADLSDSKHTSIVNAFCTRVKDKGYVPMIYANKSMLLDDMNVSDIPSENLIWMANFSNKNAPDVNSTSYSKRLNCWQFTSQYTQFGTAGLKLIGSTYVDMDFWYGYFPKEGLTVSFDSKGGSKVDSQTVRIGEKVRKPGDPTYDGYYFLGWYKSDMTTPWNFYSDTIKEKTTLYAKWEQMATLIFNTNGGSTIKPQYVRKGYKATKPKDPTKKGYVFAGWYKDSGLSEPWDFDSEIIDKVETKTLYAKWRKIHKVSFDTDGATAVSPQNVVDGDSAVKPADVPYKEGHTFRGWFRDKKYEQPWDFENDKVTADTVIYAYMEINKYTVSFDACGGSGTGEQIVKWNHPIIKPEDPVWANHDFKGWYRDKDYKNPWRFEDYMVRDGLWLFAKWSGFSGWKEITESVGGKSVKTWKYFSDAEVMSGWLTVGGNTYYLATQEEVDANKARVIGERLTGVQEIRHIKADVSGNAVMDGGEPKYVTDTYYFNRKGVMQTGWVSDGTGRHYYDPTGGARVSSGWIGEGKNRVYLLENGERHGAGADTIDDTDYYFDSNGQLKTGWIKLSDKWYYYDPSGDAYGAKRKAPLQAEDEEGKSTLEITVGGKKYLIDESGARATGWSADGKKYYDTNGALATGWKKIDGDWYYFYADDKGHQYGEKATGLLIVDGKLYSFGEDGKRAGSGETVTVETTDSDGNKKTTSTTTNRSGVVKTGQDGFVTTADGSEIYVAGNGKVVKDAWVTVGGDKVRLDAGGKRQTGLVKVDGKSYVFDGNGKITKPEKEGWYSVGRDGALTEHSISDEAGAADIVYLNTDGTVRTGWVNVSGRSYYCNDEGRLQTDKVIKIGRSLYGFNEKGEVLSGGMYKRTVAEDGSVTYVTASIGEAQYCVGDDGRMVTGWYKTIDINGKTEQYYFSQENGAKLTGVHKIGTGRYYFADNDGTGSGIVKADEGWVTDKYGHRYYVTGKGTLQTGWAAIDGARYYFSKDGELLTDRAVKVGTKLYYQTASGIVTGDGSSVQTIGGNKYLINPKGVLSTGWQTINGVRYYFDKTTGAALTGWQQIKGKWYQL